MPKKTRKMKQRAALRRETGSAPQRPAIQEAGSTTGAPTIAPSRAILSASPVNRGLSPLTFDYSYIYGDLKRIAVFAVFFFAVLIALSFIIK